MKGAAYGCAFFGLYIKRSTYEGGNGTAFMTLYLDRNQGVVGNREAVGG